MDRGAMGSGAVRLGLLVAVGAAAIAVALFGVALGTVLLVGVLLLCPLLMMGMHGGGHGSDATGSGNSDSRHDVHPNREHH